jgi:hypothetical protein
MASGISLEYHAVSRSIRSSRFRIVIFFSYLCNGLVLYNYFGRFFLFLKEFKL